MDTDQEKPAPRRILGLTMAQLQLLVIGVAMMVPPIVFLLIILFINFGR